jgi:hypothetical protein
MDSCKNCANAIFDEAWGEYKCKVRNIRIYDVDKQTDCPSHEKSKSTEGKHIGDMA